MINLVVITHGEFGAYLVEAAEGIVGPQNGGVRCVGISPRMSVGEVRRRIERVLSELEKGDGVVVLTDMPGGTPCNVAIPVCKDRPRVAVVSGVNLYMLVTAFNHRASAGLEDLTEKILSAGRRAVTDVKAAFLGKR